MKIGFANWLFLLYCPLLNPLHLLPGYLMNAKLSSTFSISLMHLGRHGRGRRKSLTSSMVMLLDGVRIRLKRGGRHGSELVTTRGAHHGVDVFTFFRNLNVFVRDKKRFSRTQGDGCAPQRLWVKPQEDL